MIAFFLSLAPVQAAPLTPPPTSAGIAMVEAAARAELKDPDSAKFAWPYGFVRYTPANGIEAWATCGTVNARNGYGGYTGKMAVLGSVRDGVANVVIDSPTLPENPVGKTCAAIGIPVK